MIDKLIMRIIIEEHKYAAADVKDVLKGIDALENVEGYVSVNYVGYFYNTDKDVRDCVLKWTHKVGHNPYCSYAKQNIRRKVRSY